MRSLLLALTLVAVSGQAFAHPCCERFPHARSAVRKAALAGGLVAMATAKAGAQTVRKTGYATFKLAKAVKNGVERSVVVSRRVIHNVVVAPAVEFHKHRKSVRNCRRDCRGGCDCGCDCGEACGELPQAPTFDADAPAKLPAGAVIGPIELPTPAKPAVCPMPHAEDGPLGQSAN